MSSIPRPTTIDVLEKAPYQGLFDLTFTNSRKHGLRPVQTNHCQGVSISSHTHLRRAHPVHLSYHGAAQQSTSVVEARGRY
jgi:hypothetical protein